MNLKEKQIKHTIYLELRRKALKALYNGTNAIEQKREYKKQLEEIEKEIKIYNYIKELSNNKEKLPF